MPEGDWYCLLCVPGAGVGAGSSAVAGAGAGAVLSAVPSAGEAAKARTVRAKAEVQAKAEAPAEQLAEQLKLECEVAARANDESMSTLGSSHDESMPRIDDGRLIEEPTAFPRVTLKFEGETHRHGR